VDATTQVIFESYVEQVLAPTLESEQIVALDNLAAHKSLRAKELIEARAASYSICRRTHRTSVPSKRPSRSSKVFSVRWRLGGVGKR
jgi:hypothetical protein